MVRIRAVASKPSITGICQPMRTRSYLALAETFDRLGSVLGDLYGASQPLEHDSDGLRAHFVVLDDQDSNWFC